MSWLDSLKRGLDKTSSSISNGFAKVFLHRRLDSKTLEDIEEILLQADFGPSFANKIIEEISSDKFKSDVIDDKFVSELIANKAEEILKKVAKPINYNKKDDEKAKVIMLCGVNGNGKTTTAGKMAAQIISSNPSSKVLLVACDTFRAAAVEQLEKWSVKLKCGFFTIPNAKDPASVAYSGIKKAEEEGYDIVIIDTAGRLHNKNDLMDELNKIVRVQKKLNLNYPSESILVLDATTGQNALRQVEFFQETASLSGIIITKLDSTARCGIVVAIANKFGLPIYAIGTGEQVNDLQAFCAKDFAQIIAGTRK